LFGLRNTGQSSFVLWASFEEWFSLCAEVCDTVDEVWFGLYAEVRGTVDEVWFGLYAEVRGTVD
jgi:hypothetical protein